MPIYAYKCDACGHAKDVLQKISDPPVTICPVCGADAFRKQLTAAGFQLKGSGWYVTDFRGGNQSGGDAKPASKPADAPAEKSGDSKPADASGGESKAAPAPAPAPPTTKSDS